MTSAEKAPSDRRFRVVLDTNVYISALRFPKSSLFYLWESAIHGHYILITSPTILREFAEKLRVRFQVSDQEATDFVKRIARTATVVQPTSVPDAVPNDPDDNHIVACALAGKASLIVSGDKDLLRLKEYEGIPIVRPMDFLRALGK
ncbi:MAG: putative toxin-antitoxin system toxin component, PIN family [Candidatus Competibacter sp.]